ncbi:MAG TPA: adenylate kinase [bacterium]
MMFVLFGPPGVGKGTQADLLTKNFNLIRFSMGDTLRDEVSLNTSIGSRVKRYLDQGTLAPDDLIFEIVEDFLREHRNEGVLFDGYPRNLNQAQNLEKSLAQLELSITAAIELSLNNDEIIKRMTSRRFCTNCGRIYNLLTNPPAREGVCDICHGQLVKRSDDEVDIINRRFQIYEEQTKPLVDYYKTLSVYKRIEASGSPQDVNAKIAAVINAGIK